MKTVTKYFRCHIFFLFLFILVGCGTTAVIQTHPLLSNSQSSDVAKVYFLRADHGFDGVGDIAFTISIHDQDLLTLAKGEYTLLYLKEFSGNLTVESNTVVSRGSWSKVKETLQFKIEKGNTYYVTFRSSFNESVNGRSYIPFTIAEDVARSLSRDLSPAGIAIDLPLE